MASPLARLSAKAVHITTDPIPRSLTESKQILAALQKFGEVVTFRNLWYDPKNSSPAHARHTVAIFDTRDAASRALAASPLNIPLPPAKANTARNIAAQAGSYVSTAERQPRFLRCRIQQSHHNHESAVKRNPYYSFFEVDRDTPQYRDVVNSTQIPLRDLAGGFLDKKEKKRKIYAENEKWGATSLWGMYEQGLKAERKGDKGDRGASSSGEGEGRAATEGG